MSGGRNAHPDGVHTLEPRERSYDEHVSTLLKTVEIIANDFICFFSDSEHQIELIKSSSFGRFTQNAVQERIRNGRFEDRFLYLNQVAFEELCKHFRLYNDLSNLRACDLLNQLSACIKMDGLHSLCIISRSLLELSAYISVDVNKLVQNLPGEDRLTTVLRSEYFLPTEPDLFDELQKPIWGGRSRDIEDALRRAAPHKGAIKPLSRDLNSDNILTYYETLSEFVHPFRSGFQIFMEAQDLNGTFESILYHTRSHRRNPNNLPLYEIVANSAILSTTLIMYQQESAMRRLDYISRRLKNDILFRTDRRRIQKCLSRWEDLDLPVSWI